MAITTLSELKTAVANWLARDDLTSRIPEFIALFEANANRRLRVRQMEAGTVLTPSGGSAALPSDYLAWRRVTWRGARQKGLDYAPPAYLDYLWPSPIAAEAQYFTIEGETLKVRPLDDTQLGLLYFQKIPGLSDAAPSNWLLAAHPDLYLFGALVEASAFTLDLENGAFWKSRRDELYDEVEKLSNKSRGAGAVRVLGATP